MSSARANMSRSSKEELEAVQIESNHTIDIDSFVPSDEIDQRYLDQSLLHRARRQGRCRCVRRDPRCHEGPGPRGARRAIVLTNREHIIAIEPLGKGLLGTTLRFPYEVRDEEDYLRRHQEPRRSPRT